MPCFLRSQGRNSSGSLGSGFFGVSEFLGLLAFILSSKVTNAPYDACGLSFYPMKNESYNLGFVAFNNPHGVESMIVSLKKWQPRGLNRCLLVDIPTDDSARKAIEATTKSAGWGYRRKMQASGRVNKVVSMSSIVL